jgi:hypothetical protein
MVVDANGYCWIGTSSILIDNSGDITVTRKVDGFSVNILDKNYRWSFKSPGYTRHVADLVPVINLTYE